MTPSDKQLAAETLEEVAERIAREWIPEYDDNEVARGLYLDILSALCNERERAAKICEQGAMLASPVGVIPADDPEHERLQRLATILNSAAKAIREGK